jgi:hypothetical protein
MPRARAAAPAGFPVPPRREPEPEEEDAMPEWLVWTLWIAGALVVVFLVGGMCLPREFKVSRSVVIAAAPETIHPYLDDLSKWPRWSPFDTEDPSIVWEPGGGPVAGVGAKRSWKSRKMGDGSQWITASDPRKGVSMKLAMAGGSFEPFDIEFTLNPESGGTRVEWTDSGRVPSGPHWRWMGKLMIEPMCGRSFEKGLSALKRLVEAESGVPVARAATGS